MHPLGVVPNAPPCVSSSECECEAHRWPIGLIAKRTGCIHIAPMSLADPQLAYDLVNLPRHKLHNLTYKMTSFLNRDIKSFNPKEQKLRPDSIEHALTASSIIDDWIEKQDLGLHNDTVWLYYGSATVISVIFPPNNCKFSRRTHSYSSISQLS